MLFKQYQIEEDKIGNYDLNKCINDNINDNNGRYLLLEIKSNLSTLIVKNIKIENPEKEILILLMEAHFLMTTTKIIDVIKLMKFRNMRISKRN